jgi:hypothetical protein
MNLFDVKVANGNVDLSGQVDGNLNLVLQQKIELLQLAVPVLTKLKGVIPGTLDDTLIDAAVAELQALAAKASV